MPRVSYPNWIDELVDWSECYVRAEARMDLAHELAYNNVLNGGGPFGAVITEEDGVLLAVGTNRVVADNDSTAHAEVVAIRNAQQELQSFDLRAPGIPALELYSSCSPCILCFGAIWWSGLRRVYTSATKEDAETAGFKEGPVSDKLWQIMKEEHGVEFVPNFHHTKSADRAFQKFAEIGKPY